jgi:hypothetical protein
VALVSQGAWLLSVKVRASSLSQAHEFLWEADEEELDADAAQSKLSFQAVPAKGGAAGKDRAGKPRALPALGGYLAQRSLGSVTRLCA